eukprot:scaffold8525_cov111-Isochrysis_galbana.AAC.2
MMLVEDVHVHVDCTAVCAPDQNRPRMMDHGPPNWLYVCERCGGADAPQGSSAHTCEQAHKHEPACAPSGAPTCRRHSRCAQHAAEI